MHLQVVGEDNVINLMGGDVVCGTEAEGWVDRRWRLLDYAH